MFSAGHQHQPHHQEGTVAAHEITQELQREHTAGVHQSPFPQFRRIAFTPGQETQKFVSID
jgi:hypothetical protein